MLPPASSALYHPLDAILGSPSLVRVSRVLASHGGSLDVGQIVQRTNLSAPSVRSALARLIQVGLVHAVGVGRTMVCTLRSQHPLAGAVASFFEAERRQADALLEAMREAAGHTGETLLAVWVYGSTARGTDRPDSDIDVAVVSYATVPTVAAEAFRERLSLSAPESGRRVSVVAFSADAVRDIARRRTRFWRELERDAVVVFGDPPSAFLPEKANGRTGKGARAPKTAKGKPSR